MKALNRLNEITDFESIRAEEWNYYPWKALLKENESISSRALKKMNEIIKKNESTRLAEWRIKEIEGIK